MKFERGKTTPLTGLSGEGAVLQISGTEEGNLVATMFYRARDLAPLEIHAMRQGKIRIGVTPIRSESYVMPIFVVKHEQGCFECPYSLGLEASGARRELINALANVKQLGRDAIWPLTMITMDAQSEEVVALRLASLTPTFWRIAAEQILASANVTSNVQDTILRRVHQMYPTSMHLFKRAIYREIAGIRESSEAAIVLRSN